MTPWLSDAELRDATHRKQSRAQAAALTRIGVPFKRRPDGTLLVSREAIARVLAGDVAPMQAAANGLRWSKQA